MRNVTNKIAVFGVPGSLHVHQGRKRKLTYLGVDCLNSLAVVASEPGYTKPEFVDDDVLDITAGRHPMVEVLRSDPFVPNELALGGVRGIPMKLI